MKSAIGFLLSLVALLMLMPFFIRYLKKKNINQVTSEYALEEFKQKEKTPIMGGLLFVVLPILVFVIIHPAGLFDQRTQFVLLSYLLYCSVGFIDDALIIRSHSNEGLSAKTRLLMEFVYTLFLFLFYQKIIPMQVSIPFTDIVISLKWYLFVPFMILLYMAEANAVNFTDGMDGLCAGVSFFALLPFLVLCTKNGFDSIVIFLLCVLGGLIGYLRFNFHPAKIFMGDSGSLYLGFMIAVVSILGSTKGATLIATIVPFLVLGLPIFDTIFAIIRRCIPMFSA